MPQMVKNPSATQDIWFQSVGQEDLLEKGMANHSSILGPMDNVKRQKDMTLEDEPPRLVSGQHVTEEEWRNSSRKNEEAGPKPSPRKGNARRQIGYPRKPYK